MKRDAAGVLPAYLFLWLLVVDVRVTFPAPSVLGAWYGSVETAVFTVGMAACRRNQCSRGRQLERNP